MGDIVAHMSPKARAIVRRDVGGFRFKVPVDFGDGAVSHVEVGVQVMSAPLDVFDNNPVASFRMRQALERALTSDIDVKYGRGSRAIESVKFSDLLADVIVEKVRDTL